MKALHESVTKILIGDNRAIFKLIISQIMPEAITKAPSKSTDDKMAAGADKDFYEVNDASLEEPLKHGARCDSDEIATDILLDKQVSASCVRAEIFAPDEIDDIPDFNPFESSLNALYKVGDQIF